MGSTEEVLTDVVEEMSAQIDKWGHQSYDMADMQYTPETRCMIAHIPTENMAKKQCERAHNRGCLNWAHILVEEVSEAVSAENLQDTYDELIQVAAVALSAAMDMKSKC